MAYSAPEDLKLLCDEKELVRMVKAGPSQGWEHPHVQAALQEAIDQADGEIDAWIGARVDVPLETVPRIVSNLSGKIAVYNLMRRRASVPEHWASEYKRCLELLRQVAQGKILLGMAADGSAETKTTAHDPVIISAQPALPSDTWEKF